MKEKHIKRNRSLRTGINNITPIEISIIPIGEYFFAKYKGNLGVFIKKTNGIFICENWEGSFEENELDFIEIIKKPKQ